MRILFYPKDLDAGDSQRSAVEMAGAMVDAGYEVTMLGGPGLLADRARELGIEVVSGPSGNRSCVVQSVRHLSKVVRDHDVDVIHAFEWNSIARAFIVAQLCRTHAAVTGTVHARSSSPVLPRTVPLLMGSRSEAAERRTAGYTRVGVLGPWVDTADNDPANYVNVSELRTRWGLDTDGLVITVATAPDEDSSTAALESVFDTVEDLAAQGIPVQVLVVGDGPRRLLAEERAAELNAQFDRTVVVAVGELPDRGEAYAVADVVIGSDSSVLHGMAFGKPVVVEGEQGYFKAVNHASAEQFLWTGWYGVGGGVGMGKSELRNALEPLLDSSRLREYRGAYSRELAENFGLDGAVLRQLQEYRDAMDTRVGWFSTWLDLSRISAVLLFRRGLRWLQMRRDSRKHPLQGGIQEPHHLIATSADRGENASVPTYGSIGHDDHR